MNDTSLKINTLIKNISQLYIRIKINASAYLNVADIMNVIICELNLYVGPSPGTYDPLHGVRRTSPRDLTDSIGETL